MIGVLTQGCLVLYLLTGPAIYYVAPESALGEFLHRWYAWPIVLVVGLVLFTVAGTVLTYLGYPLDRQEVKRDG